MTNSTLLTTPMTGPEAEQAAEIAWRGVVVLLQHTYPLIGWQSSLALLAMTLGEVAVKSAPGLAPGDVRGLSDMLGVNLRNGVEREMTLNRVEGRA